MSKSHLCVKVANSPGIDGSKSPQLVPSNLLPIARCSVLLHDQAPWHPPYHLKGGGSPYQNRIHFNRRRLKPFPNPHSRTFSIFLPNPYPHHKSQKLHPHSNLHTSIPSLTNTIHQRQSKINLNTNRIKFINETQTGRYTRTLEKRGSEGHERFLWWSSYRSKAKCEGEGKEEERARTYFCLRPLIYRHRSMHVA